TARNPYPDLARGPCPPGGRQRGGGGRPAWIGTATLSGGGSPPALGSRTRPVHFDRRLLAMTKGVRWRIALAALIGMVGVPVAVWRLKVTANALFDVFQGEPFGEILPLIFLIGTLIIVRNALEYLRDEIADRTAARMKVELRERVYNHVLKLGAGHFDQRRTGDAVN